MWKLELCERASRDGFEFAIKSKREVRTARKTFLSARHRSAPSGGPNERIHAPDSWACFPHVPCALSSPHKSHNDAPTPAPATAALPLACSPSRRGARDGAHVLVLGLVSRGRLGAVVLKAEERLGEDLGVHALGDGDLGALGANEQLQAL